MNETISFFIRQARRVPSSLLGMNSVSINSNIHFPLGWHSLSLLQCLVNTSKHTHDPLYSLALYKDSSILAMGSRNIHVWDVSSKKVTKTVTGHAKCQPCHKDGDCRQHLVLLLPVREGGVHVVPGGEGDEQCEDPGGE